MAHSAVAIINTPHSLIFEGPDSEREHEYDGIRLFGGAVELGETPDDAMVRELREELRLRRRTSDVQHIWTGPYVSQDRAGVRGLRDFSLFYVAIDSVAELDLQVAGTIQEIPLAELDAYRHRFTDVALYGLGLTIARGYTNIRHAA
jgi:8-oxo-dGTP pyrophosphatase MutT (NUDIX family)